jgi:hypothetical protein
MHPVVLRCNFKDAKAESDSTTHSPAAAACQGHAQLDHRTRPSLEYRITPSDCHYWGVMILDTSTRFKIGSDLFCAAVVGRFGG